MKSAAAFDTITSKPMKAPVNNPAIAVVGSLNLDTLVTVPHFPQPGGTVTSEGWEMRFGGKGANQALAALRQGAVVSMIGCVGNDTFGDSYLEYLTGQGMNVSSVASRPNAGTGSALVFVNPAGENCIVVLRGANGLLTRDDVLAEAETLKSADIVLCQLETTLEATVAALRRANELHKTTIFNPSPLLAEFPWGHVTIDFLIVNEREAAALLGFFVESTSEAPQVRSKMAGLGVSTLIVTRGPQPTFAFNTHQALKIPPPQVNTVDTVGAGDAFTGAFAVHWAQSHDLLGSIRKANITGALTTTKPGAQEAIPSREEVDNFGS